MLEYTRIDGTRWIVNYRESGVPSNPYHSASQIDPGSELDAVLSRVDFNRHMNLVIFGLENGPLVSECFKRMSFLSRLILIQITDESGHFTIDGDRNLAVRLNDERVLLIGGTLEQILRVMPEAVKLKHVASNMRNVNIITLPCQKALHSVGIVRIIRQFFDSLTALAVSFGNSTEDVLIGSDNFINNWMHYLEGMHISPFSGIYAGAPAIIVGAGPSLDGSFEMLRKAKGKALILAVDAALKPLLKHGIIPDMVSTIERLDVTKKFYSNLEIPDTIVFCGPSIISGDVLGRFKRRIFTGRQGDGFMNDFEDLFGHKNLEIGMNVAHIPFAAAVYFGCTSIAMVGVDLAYRDGKTHTSDVADALDDKTRKTYEGNTRQVMGQDGSLLQTYEYFLYSKVWFEEQIAKHPYIHFLNASRGGARILGAEECGLEAFVERLGAEAATEPLWSLYDHSRAGESRRAGHMTHMLVEHLSTTQMKLRNFLESVEGMRTVLATTSGNPLVQIYSHWEEQLSFFRQNPFLGSLFQPLYVKYNFELFSMPVMPNANEVAGFVDTTDQYLVALLAVGTKILESLMAYCKVLSLNAGLLD